MKILKCVDLTYEGLGVVRDGELVIFVENLLPGEEAEIEITEQKKRFAFGKVVKRLNDSPQRVTPEYEQYEICGSAQTMHMSKELNAQFKTQTVQNTINKQIENCQVEELFQGATEFTYRSKVLFPIRIENGEVICGPYMKKSQTNIHTPQSWMLTKRGNQINNHIIKKLQNMLPSTKALNHVQGVMYRVNSKGEYMVVIIVNKKVNIKPFLDYISEIDDVISVYLNINTNRKKLMLGNQSIHFGKSEYITEYLNGIEYLISPTSFFQINKEVTEQVLKDIIEVANFNKGDVVVDAYCGTGTIALNIASKVKYVYGIETSKSAVQDAKSNAALNNIDNAKFSCADVVKQIPNIQQNIDFLIVDPPRKGNSKQFLQFIVESGIKKIIYMSCNPTTLANDLKFLKENGYNFNKVKTYDMFPQTAHVETVVLMSRVEK